MFAEQGATASIADIARRAGVGEATVVRRFPTKDDLLVALLGERMSTLAERAAREAERAPVEEGLERFMGAMAEQMANDRGLVEALSDRQCAMAGPLYRERAHIYANVTALLECAQAAGRIRSDLHTSDVLYLTGAVTRAPFANMPDPLLWRRYLALLIGGLRPGGEALPAEVPAPTLHQMEASMAAEATRHPA